MPTQDLAQTSVPTSEYAPRISGPLPGPKARAIVEADDRWISPTYTRSYPLVAKRGRGTRVEDVDGNEFLDFAAGIAVTSTGHCHPEVVKAIQQQAGELIHMSGTDFYYESLVTLAERLSADRAHARAAPLLLRQLRRRSRRVRPEARPLPHRPPEHHRLLRRLPRPHHGRAFAHRVEAAAEAPLRPAGPRRHPRALSLRLSRLLRRPAGAGSLRTGVRPLHRREAVQDHAAAGRGGRHLRRADPGRGRLRRRAHHLHAGAAAGSATGTASCWWPTRCSPAPAAPASGGRSSIPASSPTSSAWPRASPPACRSASA